MKDSGIDTSDMPEVLDWSSAVVGRFYRPIKKQVSIRLDADILQWFMSVDKKGYQSRINDALRQFVNAKTAQADQRVKQTKAVAKGAAPKRAVGRAAAGKAPASKTVARKPVERKTAARKAAGAKSGSYKGRITKSATSKNYKRAV